MIAIIDSGIGNIRSVSNALEYLKATYSVTADRYEIKKADKIIFPGVGSFADGMKTLKELHLIDILHEEVVQNGKLYLGICLGMQLLLTKGFEDGEYEGLNWIKGVVRKIKADKMLKLPHIGWNTISPKDNNVLFNDLEKNPSFYFVHSYIIDPDDKSIVTSTCDYGESFTASIQKNNIFGVQFHPEKSQKNGLQLLKNFVSIH